MLVFQLRHANAMTRIFTKALACVVNSIVITAS